MKYCEDFERSRRLKILNFSKLSYDDLKEVVWNLNKVVKYKTGRSLPEDPKDQLKFK